MAFSQVDHRIQGNDRADEFVISVDAFQGRQGEHAAVIKNLVPLGTGYGFEPIELFIVDQQDLPAFRAGIQQFLNVEAGRTTQTTVDHPAGGFRNQVGLNGCGEIFRLHVAIESFPPI